MTAYLITTNYPPIGGGVSRYNYGLVRAGAPRIKVPGWGQGEPPPVGDGICARIQQTLWARRVSLSLPKGSRLLASQPHLGVGCWLARRPFVQFVHGGEWENYPMGRFLFQAFLKRSQLSVFNSEATLRRLTRASRRGSHLVLKPGLSEVTPVGLPKGNIGEPVSQREPSFRVLAVSRLSPRKGHKRLIAAVEKCHASGLNITLRIVGSGEIGLELEALVSNLKCVTLDSGLPDAELQNAYDEADVFALLPEEIRGREAWEGFGIVFLEAAARGLPILATNSGGIPEATCADGAILLSETCGEQEIAEALHRLAEDVELRMQMSEANIGWAKRNTWSARANQLDEIMTKAGGAVSHGPRR